MQDKSGNTFYVQAELQPDNSIIIFCNAIQDPVSFSYDDNDINIENTHSESIIPFHIQPKKYK